MDNRVKKYFVNLEDAVCLLKRGKPLIIETDTVCGVCVAVDYASTPNILYEIKGRNDSNPIAWLIDDIESLKKYSTEYMDYVEDLIASYWPGALTIVVNASNFVREAYLSQNKTIGLRMPDCAHVLNLIKSVGCPLATTSANFSGDANCKTISDLSLEFVEMVGAIYLPSNYQLDASYSDLKPIASTVVDCTQTQPIVLRQGSICLY